MATQGGKSGGKQLTVAEYSVGMHMALCHGPVDSINSILIDQRIAWKDGITGSGTITINAPLLFGGSGREGGVTGDVDIQMGLTSQSQNSYLAVVLGNLVAYRGVVSAILKRVVIGANYYIKPWSFVVTRIHTRRNGISQWQDGLAEITNTSIAGNILPGTVTSLTHVGTVATLLMSLPHNLLVGGLITISGVSGFNGTFYNGTFVIKTDNFTFNQLSYDMLGTPSAPASGSIVALVGAFSSVVKLINAVHVVRECLTDPTWGLGVSDGLIHEASFLASAQTCVTEGIGFSFLWDTPGTIEDFIIEVLTHIQGSLYLDRIDGLFHLNLTRRITNLTGLLTLNITNTREVSEFRRQSVGELTSEVIIKFFDMYNYQDSSIRIHDPGLEQRQSSPRSKTITYSGVVTADTALKLATRDLRQLSTPLYTCAIRCDRSAENLNIGDAFILDWPDYLDTTLVMRVLSISLGTSTNQQISIDAIQDVFDAADLIYYTPPTSAWIDPITYPVAMPLRGLIESPYYAIAITKGDVFAQAVHTTSSYTIVYGPSPTPDSIAAGIWSTTGSTFTRKGSLDFCFSGLLQSNMDKVVTSLVVINPTDIRYLAIGQFISIGNEFLGVTNIVANTLTVIRGVLDTVPQVHTANDRVYGVQDFLSSDQVEYIIGETCKTKLTTITSRGELVITAAPEDDLITIGRMHRPYPPGNFKLNGVYWPVAVYDSAGLTITWVSRNRFQQTAGLIDYYTGAITSETGVTYSGEMRRTDTSAILDSFSGSSAFTFAFTTSYLGPVVINLWSINANGISFQIVSHNFTRLGSTWDNVSTTWDNWNTWG